MRKLVDRLIPGRRGTVAVMTAVMLPALLGAAGLAIDVGVWYRESVRLQIAADAGAFGAARLLSLKTTGTSAYQAAALIEVNGVTGGSMIGTLQTPVTVSYAANWSQVTVTLTSTPASYFAAAIGYTPSAITATATVGLVAPTACVLALSKTASPAIQVDNNGNIVASGCGVFSDSTSGTSIYLNCGTISGSSVGSAGTYAHSTCGNNNLSPSPATNSAASESDPESALTVPSYGTTCNTTNYTAYGTYHITQANNVFCGSVTIGGNGSTDSFDPGTYFVIPNGTTPGSLTFNNANVISASGVTFVITGSSVGAFTWQNNSAATMTAPTTGALAGILVWQTATSSCSNPANTFNGGGTLQVSGIIYTPCGALDINNNAKLTAVTGGSFSAVAQTMYVTGGASLDTSTASGATSASQLVLMQ